ncbi:MAG: hypothetical protein U5N27_06465, partial [Rhizobium sp.]|nr:hypothetical protein [Rhizobium sp.]
YARAPRQHSARSPIAGNVSAKYTGTVPDIRHARLRMQLQGPVLPGPGHLLGRETPALTPVRGSLDAACHFRWEETAL